MPPYPVLISFKFRSLGVAEQATTQEKKTLATTGIEGDVSWKLLKCISRKTQKFLSVGQLQGLEHPYHQCQKSYCWTCSPVSHLQTYQLLCVAQNMMSCQEHYRNNAPGTAWGRPFFLQVSSSPNLFLNCVFVSKCSEELMDSLQMFCKIQPTW